MVSLRQAAGRYGLSERLRTLKLQYRLKEQRLGQYEWLRYRQDSPRHLVLEDLLAGRTVEAAWDSTLGREVLLAFQFWILDHRSDGQRRGFPFDPYLLSFHRRLVRAGPAVDHLLSRTSAACRTSQVIRNFQALLPAYRNDPEIQAAADEQNPDRPLARIVLIHLDKYWGHILPDQGLAAGERWQRTTNQLESDWGGLKRGRRRTHGGALTRDFQSLPEEYLLIRNLENETYPQVVLDGRLESLPGKLARASREAGSFDAWRRRRRRPRLIGELPRRLLRDDDFLEQFLDTCIHYCQATSRQAA
jgi:hypothetical protein